MENLPVVVLRKLFQLMPSTNERIKCSHVCKNWRAGYKATMNEETLCLYSQEFVPLSHRLFYTNERVSESSFVKIPRSYDYLQFLNSNASDLFVNIKKLVIFGCFEDPYMKSPELRFCNQLNRFKSLEHAEISCNMPALEGAEIDLPRLKVLSFWGIHQFEGENVPIVLKTPSLQALRIGRRLADRKELTIGNFKFILPHSLLFLEMANYEPNFKFETEFVNLECLVFHYIEIRDWEDPPAVRSFGDDFLKSLPSLKLLYFDGNMNDLDLAVLGAEKEKFGMKNLKIIQDEEPFEEFNYRNYWLRYVQHKQQLMNWPKDFEIVFDKLINYRIPLDLFKENYLRIRELKVRLVADQPLLVDFLRKTDIGQLTLDYDCNLGQSFFDEIADSVTLNDLALQGYDCGRLSDPSVLSKLRIFRLEMHFQQFPRDAVLAMLNNRPCFMLGFYKFDEFMDAPPEEDGEDGRREPNTIGRFSHNTQRVGSDFLCHTCGWISSNDPNRLNDPVRITLQHVEGELSMRNMTGEEYEIHLHTSTF